MGDLDEQRLSKGSLVPPTAANSVSTGDGGMLSVKVGAAASVEALAGQSSSANVTEFSLCVFLPLLYKTVEYIT